MALSNSEKQKRFRKMQEKVINFYEKYTGMDQKEVRKIIRITEGILNNGQTKRDS